MVFLGAKLLQRRTGVALLNPILISIIVLIVILLSCGVDHETYAAGGEYIEFWLKPAVVALGVPLYRQLERIYVNRCSRCCSRSLRAAWWGLYRWF